jgi:hypothetical protein
MFADEQRAGLGSLGENEIAAYRAKEFCERAPA